MENKIKELIKILEESTINEIDVSTFWGKQRIRIKKYSDSKSNNDNFYIKDKQKDQIIDLEENKIESQNTNIEFKDDLDNSNNNNSFNETIIKAPLVGTFYKSPKPEDPPFISIGDKIKIGQVICIIEAMKIFNEIESDVEGVVKDILVTDGTPVEFDQDLIILSNE